MKSWCKKETWKRDLEKRPGKQTLKRELEKRAVRDVWMTEFVS